MSCYTCNLVVLCSYSVAIEAKPFIEYFKKNGCIIIHKCTSIRHAKVSTILVHYLTLIMVTLFTEF